MDLGVANVALFFIIFAAIDAARPFHTTTMASATILTSRIPWTGKRVEPRSCICGDKRCGDISKAFRDLNNVRGSYCTKLCVDPTSNRKATTEIKRKKARRIAVHLQLDTAMGNLENSVDARNRFGLHSETPQTRSALPKKKQSLKYIVWHHFHPKAIQKFACTGTNRVVYKDALPLQFVKENSIDGLVHIKLLTKKKADATNWFASDL